MYHVIRGQAVIKLYIFFNMLDVGDRLLASFGQVMLFVNESTVDNQSYVPQGTNYIIILDVKREIVLVPV